MLVKRKKKVEFLDDLEGLKFIHENTSLIYTISKKEDDKFFTISWGLNEGADYFGSKYSREDIVENISTGVWKVIS